MQDIEKLVDAAIDLRIATLRAEEQGIICYTDGINGETYQIFKETDFKELIKDREYTVKTRPSLIYFYEYSTKVAGLNFIYITEELLFEDDEKLLEEAE